MISINLITIIAAVIISWLIFTALVSFLKTTVKTALIIAVIVLLLQLGLGIKPEKIFQEIIQIPQTIWQQFQPKQR